MISARNVHDRGITFDGARFLSDADFALENARTRVSSGDVLLTIVGTIGRVAVVPATARPFALQRSVAVLKPRLIEARFLAYALETSDAQSWLSSNAKGTAQKGIYLNVLGDLPVPLAPVAEQVRIADRLDEVLSDLDAAVSELELASRKLTQYRQSLLKAAVEGDLTAEWRGRNPPQETGAELLERILRERRARWAARQLEQFAAKGGRPPSDWQSKYIEPVQADLTGLPSLPKQWVWASLDMLGEIAAGVAKGGKVSSDDQLREVPYLRVANVQRGYLNLEEVKTIMASERDIADLTLKPGDVLFNEGGDRDKLGRGWVWKGEVSDCIHQNHVFRMRPISPDLVPEFISHHGNTFGRRWFEAAGKQTTNLASINLGMLRSFPVPVPPVAEQRQIVLLVQEQLGALQDQEAAVERGLKMAAAQRQNILRAAFSGQLVPQDPSDEPASVLLARIRAQRVQAAPAPARKTRRQSGAAA
jgi:type I restriction enzyme S subunit